MALTLFFPFHIYWLRKEMFAKIGKDETINKQIPQIQTTLFPGNC